MRPGRRCEHLLGHRCGAERYPGDRPVRLNGRRARWCSCRFHRNRHYLLFWLVSLSWQQPVNRCRIWRLRSQLLPQPVPVGHRSDSMPRRFPQQPQPWLWQQRHRRGQQQCGIHGAAFGLCRFRTTRLIHQLRKFPLQTVRQPSIAEYRGE